MWLAKRPVLEIELVLAALLRGAGGDEALVSSVAEDVSPEFLIYKDAGTILRHSTCHGGLEAIEDHLLRSSDLRRLLRVERFLPTEQVF
jgi:hypothetical protein